MFAEANHEPHLDARSPHRVVARPGETVNLRVKARDPDKDFVIISAIESQGILLALNEKIPAKNLEEFVAYAKKADHILYIDTTTNGTLIEKRFVSSV